MVELIGFSIKDLHKSSSMKMKGPQGRKRTVIKMKRAVCRKLVLIIGSVSEINIGVTNSIFRVCPLKTELSQFIGVQASTLMF